MRLEKEAEKREKSLNRLVVELAIEAIERREWLRIEAEIHLLRSAVFAARAIIRDIERAGGRMRSSESAGISPKLRRKSRANRREIDLRERKSQGTV